MELPETLNHQILTVSVYSSATYYAKPFVLNLCYSDVFGLQLPEAFTISSVGWGFWELQFKNT